MKKVFKVLAGLVAGAALVFGMSACGSPTSGTGPMPGIQSFTFDSPSAEGSIDQTAGTIAVQVPEGTDLTNLVPKFTLSNTDHAEVKGVRQVSGVTAVNFSAPVVYKIIGGGGISREYTVSVSHGVAVAKELKSLSLQVQYTEAGESKSAKLTGIIDQSAKTVTVTAPTGLSLTAAKVFFEVSPGTKAYHGTLELVSGESVISLDGGLELRVEAADGTSVKYALAAVLAPATASKDNTLTSLSVAGADIPFQSDVSSYTVNVGSDVPALNLSSLSAGAGSKILVNGQPVSGTSSVPLVAGENRVVVTVVAENGFSKDYIITVNKEAPVVYETKLITFGFVSPAVVAEIDEAAKTVSVTVPAGTALEALTPVFTLSPSGVLQVGSQTLTSGSGSLNASSSLILTVAAPDGKTASYTLKVTAAAAGASSDSTLKSLSVTPGTLVFSAATLEYTLDVAAEVTQIALKAETTHAKASILYKGSKVASGQEFTVGLAAGENKVQISVAAENGTARTYTLTVRRAFENKILSFEFADLKAAGRISHTTGTIAVTVPFGTPVNKLVATFTVSAGAKVLSYDVPQTSGVTLNDFTSPVEYAVVGGDGKVKAYTVTVTKASAALSSDSSLLDLAVQGQTLGFSTTKFDYALDVPNEVSSAVVLATVRNVKASVQINSYEGATRTVDLVEGANTVNIQVIAEDGTFSLYKIKITRATRVIIVEPSKNANLASLSVAGQTLSTAFDPAVTSYSVNVANTVSSVVISAVAAETGATVEGAGTKAVAEGENTFTLKVTAPDGTTSKTYTLIIRRANSQGTLDLVITDNLAMMTITLSGWKPTLSQGEAMTITATPSETVQKYTWYLNGTLQGSTTNTLALGSGLAAGTYNLSLVAETATKLASGSVTFTVNPGQENGSASITINTANLSLYSVTLAGGKSTLVQNTTMTLTATASLAPDSYTWYLDGKVIAGASGSSYTVPGTTALGYHRIDVVAKKGTKLASAFQEFTVTPGQIETVATPTFSVAAGEVDSGTTVTFASATAAAAFHYTLDGTDPTTSSPSGTSVTLTEAKTVKVMAVKSGMNNSQVASASYTIKPVQTGTFTIVFKNNSNAQNVSFPGDVNNWNLSDNAGAVAAGATKTITYTGAVTSANLGKGASATALELKVVSDNNWDNSWGFGTWTKNGVSLTENNKQINIAAAAGKNVTLTIDVATTTLTAVVQ